MGSQALFAALEIGLFTELAAGPASAAELAHRLGLEPRPILALLEACAATELLEREGDRYRNSAAASRYLVRHARGYMGDYYLRQIAATLYAQVPAAAAVIRGRRRRRDLRGLPGRPRADRGVHPGPARGLVGSRVPARAKPRPVGVHAAPRSRGRLGGLLDRDRPAARRCRRRSSTIPSVVAVARKIVAESGLADRIHCVPGDAVAGPVARRGGPHPALVRGQLLRPRGAA